MNDSIIYLIGGIDDNGEFWCTHETPIEQDAFKFLEKSINDYPRLNFQIIQKTVTYKALASPKDCLKNI